MERPEGPVPDGQRGAEILVVMLNRDGVVNLVLGGGDKEPLQPGPVADLNVGMTEVRPGDVKDEDEHVHAHHRVKVHRPAEQENENRHGHALRDGASQAVKNALQRVHAIDRHGRQRGRGMMHLVDGPEDRPEVHPAVHQVFREVVGDKQRHREKPDDNRLVRIGELTGAQKVDLMQREPDRRRDGELRQQ